MESFPPYPIGPGQRTLAAIVFTDVVSFSARMQADEEKTLAMLERDFAAMRKICTRYSGSVLKTTGDGLLLYFTSAVQAVACALRIQRHFAEAARSLPPNEVLGHRVGIHLGDVFVNDQDVMGDGVNIASRLQAEAEPGGICISQTVYDVVKNKLALKVTLLGPRELKNISDAIPVYRLVLEAQSKGALASTPPTSASRPPAPASVWRWQLATLASLALVGVVVLGLILRANRLESREAASNEAARTAINSLLDTSGTETDRLNRERLIHAVADWRQELRTSRSRLPAEYNFAELARELHEAKAGTIDPANLEIRYQVLQRMQVLFGWMGAAMQRHGKDKPLVVPELSGADPKEIRVFAGADRRLYFAQGGAILQRNWTEQKPAMLGAIIVGLLLETTPVPAREIVQGAQAFAYFYGLPEMNEALRNGRMRRTGK